MSRKVVRASLVLFVVLSVWWVFRNTAIAVDWWGPLGFVVALVAVVPALFVLGSERPRPSRLRILTASAMSDVLVVAAFALVATVE